MWLANNRRAITGLRPAYGCFIIQDDVSFTLGPPPPHPKMLDSENRSICGPPYFTSDMGGGGGPPIQIIAGGGITATALLSGAWLWQDAVGAAVNASLAHGWEGLEIDDEFCCDAHGYNQQLVNQWISFVGNLSGALSHVGKRLHVDVNSYPYMDISGPHHIPAIAGLGRRSHLANPPILMDMSTYWAPGAAGPHTHTRNVSGLQALGVPLSQISLGIGMVEERGHENASCTSCHGVASSLDCGQMKSQTCGNCGGCMNYGWSGSSLRSFVQDALAAGISKLLVYRQDLFHAPMTTSKVPPWFLDTMADFINSPLPLPPPRHNPLSYKTDDHEFVARCPQVNDCTAGLQQAFDDAAVAAALYPPSRPTVQVPELGRPWIIAGRSVQTMYGRLGHVGVQLQRNHSGIRVVIERGVLLLAKRGSFKSKAAPFLQLTNVSNVSIVGYGAEIRMFRQDYNQTVGVQKPNKLGYIWSMDRHGILLNNVQNVDISGLTVTNTGGDGLCLIAGVPYASSWSSGCQNVTIRDCVFDRNYRQVLFHLFMCGSIRAHPPGVNLAVNH
eukprot:SAG11_NODE_190_length_12980_cov_11.633802_7_plen_557_part_00